MNKSVHTPNFPLGSITEHDITWRGVADERPPSDFVVARSKNGKAVSIYADTIWDFSAYVPDGSSGRINFGFWCGNNPSPAHRVLMDELRWIMFCNMWKRPGGILAISSHRVLHFAACKLAAYAYAQSTSIAVLLGTEAEFILMARVLSPYDARNLRHLMSSLEKVGESELDFALVPIKLLDILSRKVKTRQYEQTAAIPSRLYCQLLEVLGQQLTEVEKFLVPLIKIAQHCSKHPFAGQSFASQISRTKAITGISFDTATSQPDFTSLAQRYGISKYLAKCDVGNIRGLSHHFSMILTLCKTAVHAYSGMRDNEVETLPLDCLTTERLGGINHNVVSGKTYKFSGGMGIRTKWVVGEDAARAIRIVKQISEAAFTISGVSFKKNSKETESLPLFASPRYLNLGCKPVEFSSDRPLRAMNLHLKAHRDWVGSLNLIITQLDVDELVNIDPFRAWNSEAYQLGRLWPLTTHQLRRSLALYASRSGFVTLPSLRRQLQHITQEMTQYYARGSTFALNIVDSPEGRKRRHFMMEMQDTSSESEFFSYLFNAVATDERLHGGQGTILQRSKDKDEIYLAKFDRETTLKEFRNGLRSYKETPLGGCGKVGECVERSSANIMGCILADGSSLRSGPKPCKDSFLTVRGIHNVIQSQEKKLQQETLLDPTSLYCREAIEDLTVLKQYLERFSENNDKAK
ncbi:hypothetical protein [Janthinobacterium lividum]|uniref:hypothetical protein n=1 Tax=Janthinobacterium lividum TaxID=29581 RepID=UPI0004467177|nr:hypothetical protein [Janthinobacterium lividum]EZP42016.1 hypothetical protein BW37_00796 [Janthinobacterium lividum]